MWLALDRCRLVSATLAWGLSCLLVYGELRARDRLEKRRQSTEGSMRQWRWRVDELSGRPEVFEPLVRIPATDRKSLTESAAALRKLIAVHQVHSALDSPHIHSMIAHSLRLFFLDRRRKDTGGSATGQ